MREERAILETIVFAYLVGQCNWSPIKARTKVTVVETITGKNKLITTTKAR